MRHTAAGKLGILIAVAITVTGGNSFAQDTSNTNVPVITGATANLATNPATLTIAGQNFGTVPPTVKFANAPLTVSSFSATSVVANLPAGVSAGSYQVVLVNNTNPNSLLRTSLPFDVTLGSGGPQGPPGPVGPSNVYINSSPGVVALGSSYTTLGTLTLPQGSYLLTGITELTYFIGTQVRCSIFSGGTSLNSTSAYSTAAETIAPVTMAAPFQSPSGGATLTFSCEANFSGSTAGQTTFYAIQTAQITTQ